VLRQIETLRSMVGFVPRPGRLKDVVWTWLERHWTAVSVVVSTTVAALLLATATLPPLLAPFVLGPLAAVVVTALIAPRNAVGQATRAERAQRRRHV
jgi:hypothetical protein